MKETKKSKKRPAMTREERENEMIALAFDAAEKRLREGKASSQEIVHFLKLGSIKARTEQEILEKQKRLIDAKADMMESSTRYEELVSEAIEAFKTYAGKEDEDD